jgi:urease gamma subunit
LGDAFLMELTPARKTSCRCSPPPWLAERRMARGLKLNYWKRWR